MFVDTKNIVNANTNLEACNTMKSCNTKTNGKLRGLWKLLTFRKNSKRRSSAIAHPNNVHLNNNNADLKDRINELPRTQLEDYCAKIVADSTEQHFIQNDDTLSNIMDNANEQLIKVISSASIEKSTNSTVIGCVYGRNCQHNYKAVHSKQLIENFTEPVCFTIESQQQLGGEHVPIHHLHTEDGSFFWPESFERIDDDLLNVWLCHSLGEFPTQATAFG